jgi:hypothetical protein
MIWYDTNCKNAGCKPRYFIYNLWDFILHPKAFHDTIRDSYCVSSGHNRIILHILTSQTDYAPIRIRYDLILTMEPDVHQQKKSDVMMPFGHSAHITVYYQAGSPLECYLYFRIDLIDWLIDWLKDNYVPIVSCSNTLSGIWLDGCCLGSSDHCCRCIFLTCIFFS